MQDSRKENSLGTLSNETFTPKSKLVKSASAYVDNDDNNLETLKKGK